MDIFKDFSVDRDIFDNELISWQARSLRIMGHIFAKDDYFKFFHFFRGLIVTLLIFSLVLAQAISTWIRLDDINNLGIPLATFIPFGNMWFRIVCFYYYRKEFIELLASLNRSVKKFLTIASTEELKIFKNYVKYIKNLYYFVAIPCTFYFSAACLDGFYFLVFSPEKWKSYLNHSNSTVELPLIFLVYPMKALNENSFHMIFIAPYYISLIALPSLLSWHTLNASIMRYISFRMDIINYRMAHLENYKIIDTETRSAICKPTRANDCKDLWRLAFIESVKDFAEIRSFTKKYEFISATAFFIESATASFAFCVLLYILSSNFTGGYGIFVIWYLVLVGNLFIYFWYGNELSLKNDEITFSLYSSNWYEFPINFQKELALFMQITIQPIVMKSAFINMNISAFLTIMRLSYSYFTLLRNAAE